MTYTLSEILKYVWLGWKTTKIVVTYYKYLRSMNINKKRKNHHGHKIKCKPFRDQTTEFKQKPGKVGADNNPGE